MVLEKTGIRKLSTIIFIIVSAIVFIIAGIRCATVPFNHDETATFFYYIQSGDFLPFLSHVDANNHILNSGLGWVCYKLFGDSPFSLRLPNLLALLILIIATSRISKQLTQTSSKLVLMAGFLLSFHWLSFFSTCRGYGLYMAFLVLAVSYLIEYFNSKELKKLFLFYLFIHIAISAILILIIVAVILTFAIILFQVSQKELLKKQNIIALLIHVMLIIFWIKYSFFLQDKNALYAGVGISYWKVTFISLIQLLTGSHNKYVPFLILFCFIALVIAALARNFKQTTKNISHVFTPSLFYTLILICLIAAFYAMKIFLNINYPEDRTALFFYAFFVIALAFTLDMFIGRFSETIAYLITSAAMIHFVFNVNFHKHSVSSYETIPERFYTYLLNEQKSNPERITIEGHRLREFIYDFLNYRHGGALNLIDAPEETHMNCDYAIAWKKQEQYYKPYYDEVDIDKDWGITLLKRKEKIKRDLLFTVDTLKTMQGNWEYYDLYGAKDSGFRSRNPLLVEFNLGWIQGEMPVKSWLVVEVDTADGQDVYYKRIPLNWLRYDWANVKDQELCLVTGQLPAKFHRLKCYLWNLEKKDIKFKMNSVKIYQLEGDGVNVTAPPPY